MISIVHGVRCCRAQRCVFCCLGIGMTVLQSGSCGSCSIWFGCISSRTCCILWQPRAATARPVACMHLQPTVDMNSRMLWQLHVVAITGARTAIFIPLVWMHSLHGYDNQHPAYWQSLHDMLLRLVHSLSHLLWGRLSRSWCLLRFVGNGMFAAA